MAKPVKKDPPIPSLQQCRNLNNVEFNRTIRSMVKKYLEMENISIGGVTYHLDNETVARRILLPFISWILDEPDISLQRTHGKVMLMGVVDALKNSTDKTLEEAGKQIDSVFFKTLYDKFTWVPRTTLDWLGITVQATPDDDDLDDAVI